MMRLCMSAMQQIRAERDQEAGTGYFPKYSIPTLADADAVIQRLKTPMEDARQTQPLLNAAADRFIDAWRFFSETSCRIWL
jgi:hypothetical protein